MNKSDWVLGRIYLKKLVVLGLAMVTQSCVNENEPREYREVNREMAISEFEHTLMEASKEMEEFRKSGSSVLFSGKGITSEGKGAGVEIKNILEPVVTKSTSLLRTYGISEAFLKKQFGDLNDPRLILVGIWIAQAEKSSVQAQQSYRAQLADLSFFFQENTLTEVKPDWMECMIIAVGVDAIIEFAKGNVTEAIAKKAIRKIASRTLGWVGVALALYEYGSCMEWY